MAQHEKLGPQVVHAAHLPATPAAFDAVEPPLPPALEKALEQAGVARLWSHQVAGLHAARAGRDVLVTTPTASGKSLIFQLPVLEEVLAGGAGRALFLFPLKALGQDQKGKLERLGQLAGLPTDDGALAAIYDGDTPEALRREIRRRPPPVLITNPDMLHLGILGHWRSWGPLLKDLQWIVLDELHTYRGIFGSHFHHVLQRLLRLARAEGAAPSLIASSATAANAADFAHSLAGRPFEVIEGSGAPREGRHLLLLRPEASPYSTTLDLLVTLLEAGLKTIVFTKARRITELLYSWLRRRAPELAQRVASYRAGFLSQERRRIEQALFEGKLDGVISTSALEMGIDVGGLDACILVGYPGSMMATWQRSGRVGRAERESLTVLVALPDALDQYFLEHPQQLLERPCERLIVDPDNAQVARSHVLCAAAERALDRQGDAAYRERHQGRIAELLADGQLLESADGEEIFATRRRPHLAVQLRGAGDSYTVRLDEVAEEAPGTSAAIPRVSSRAGRRGRGEARPPLIGTVDGVRVLHECHPGAVYLHAGRQYVIRELDSEKREARAVAADLDYFTTPLTEKDTQILEVLAHRRDGPLSAWLGRLKVTERVLGYERKRLQSQESLGQYPLELPPVHFETVGLWWSAGRDVEETLRLAGEHFMGSLHAAEHAAISLLPTLALCDRGDIGGISIPLHPQVQTGAVFLYDGHSGGVGITAAAFEQLPQLLERVVALLESCPCEVGCPSCVQSPKCGNGNRPLDKAGAARTLRLLLGREATAVPAVEPPEILLSLPAEEPAQEVPGEALPESPAVPALRIAPAPAVSTETVAVSPPAVVAAVPAAARLPTTVVFDLETRRAAREVGGWGNVHRMGLALGVLCFLEEGRFETYTEERVGELVAALRSATLVIGFNSRGFDYRVLNGYTGEDFERFLPTLDLMQDVRERLGRRLGLDHLASETLGTGKSGDGLQCLEWVRQGRLDLVEQYCRRDVEILRDLYLFGRREGFVCYRDKATGERRRLPVDW